MKVPRAEQAGWRRTLKRVLGPLLRVLGRPFYRRLSGRFCRDFASGKDFRKVQQAVEGIVCDQEALDRRLAWLEDRMELLLPRLHLTAPETREQKAS